MAGSSIAGPRADAWVTDFLDAAYYARPEAERDVRDLRLAHGVVTTRWASHHGRRLGLRDVLAMRRAYGRLRPSNEGRLDHDALLAGARTLLGEWFPEAWADDDRRAHGIAFETVTARRRFEPEQRLREAAIGDLTPPLAAPSEQRWATYGPVALPDPERALRLLLRPARWPDIGAAAGRFTALRSTGLANQTFEIEVVALPAQPVPRFTHGYVTCTALHARGVGDSSVDEAVAELDRRYREAAGPAARPLLPPDAEPLALVELTTHEGHFLGRARSHLLLWRDAGGAFIRDVGASDPPPEHLAATDAVAGPDAQEDFWGPARPAHSMLAQLALVTG
jgi:hypothetical protein